MSRREATSYRGPMEALSAKMFDLKLIPEFDGSQPVSEWIEKFELVCELCGVTDLASVLPLRLTGGAFAVYQQLSQDDRKKVEKIKEVLLNAFALDRFIAYKRFTTRKLGAGESPDVFLAELQRLASLAGGVSESVMGCAFVTGLPEHIQDILRAGVRMEDLTLGQLLTRARAIMVNEPNATERDIALAARAPEVSPRVVGQDSTIRCYACGGANHFARECPTRLRARTATQRTGDPHSRPRGSRKNRRPLATDVPMYQGNEYGEELPAPTSSRP
uniref:CCHC-type domain-containing protein n=1 Tax=Trichuris muris TaxID=70415 RepID=A0A5S6QT68_TRIMR